MTSRKVKISKISESQLQENKKIMKYFENFEKKLEGKENKEAIIAKELKTINELNIKNYNNEQLEQFIGVNNNMIPITDFLKECIQIDEKYEDNINDFVANILADGLIIDKVFEKLFLK